MDANSPGGAIQRRNAERDSLEPLFHEPPRNTRELKQGASAVATERNAAGQMAAQVEMDDYVGGNAATVQHHQVHLAGAVVCCVSVPM